MSMPVTRVKRKKVVATVPVPVEHTNGVNVEARGAVMPAIDTAKYLQMLSKLEEMVKNAPTDALKKLAKEELKYFHMAADELEKKPYLKERFGLGGFDALIYLTGLIKTRNIQRQTFDIVDSALDDYKAKNPDVAATGAAPAITSA
jgi:hypothetical protein